MHARRVPVAGLWVIGSLILSGCSPTLRHVRLGPAGVVPDVRAEVNEGIEGRSATIVLLPDCAVVAADDVALRGDSLHYTDPGDGARKAVAAERVDRVSARSATAGAWRAAKVGLLVWGGLSAVLIGVGLAAGPARDGPPAILIAFLASAATAPLVAVAALLGAAAGDERIYQLSDEPGRCRGRGGR